MRIALAQLNYHIGNFQSNAEKIIQSIRNAKSNGCELIVFSELAICGYPPLDFLDYKDFVDKCIKSLELVAKECIGITAIVGGPAINPDINGKNLFNAAYVLEEGKMEAVASKSLLPTYDVFDEYRWFESNKLVGCITIRNCKIALTVCEDLWNMDADPLYTNWPMDDLVKEKPQLMINIAASPFSFAHREERKRILALNVSQYKLPLLYVNLTGANTDLIFDGGSLIYDSKAKLVFEGSYFEEDFIICEINTAGQPVVLGKDMAVAKVVSKEERIYKALLLGVSDFFSKMGFKKAILGLSGGIDSALVTVLAADALGKENVHTVLMPSQFSSDHSIDDSIQLVKKLGVTHEIIPIKSVYDAYLQALEKDFKGLPFNLTEENIQARIRGTLLMALSNKFGYILLNTSNKSELSVGYGTLYGDMCGGLSVIGDLYKTEVFELVEHINRKEEIIPNHILTKPPSAELRTDQKDSDSLPPYDILDKILYQYIELANGPDEIIASGLDEPTVLRILKMVNNNEFKRFQTPPILRVSSKAFGRGRRMPIVAKYLG